MLPAFLFLTLVLSIMMVGAVAYRKARAEGTGLSQLSKHWPWWGTVWVLGALYVFTLSLLQQYWYGTEQQVGFHWFDDGAEWLGMDKVGHAFSAFWICTLLFHLIRKAAQKDALAALVAAIMATMLMSSYEYFDGLSPKYGASYYDIVANTLGACLAGYQLANYGQLKWQLKYSFWPTAWEALRPNVLGATLSEQMLKDYNGQSLWLSFNPNALGMAVWPRWISISLGYGAEGMVYGRVEQTVAHGYAAPYGQLYLGIGLDLSPLTHNKRLWVRRVGRTMGMVQVPLPVLQIDLLAQGWVLHAHALYF